MNGAHALLDSLVNAGIEVCFANPGTSEMHLVTAIGKTDNVRPVLCLFEGVVSGAADGYARMSDKPAITLLHLGPGYANAMANMHNARKAFSPVVNIVGDHAVWHHQYDAPLTSDVPGHVKLHSHWHRVSESSEDLALAGAEAVQAAMTGWGKVATLIVPANHAWEAAGKSYDRLLATPPNTVPVERIEEAAAALTNGKKTAFVLGGWALRNPALETIGRVALATGATLLCETFPARLERGEGRVPLQRIPYFAEQALVFLQDFEQMILIGAKEPVAFFAYPGVASLLAPPDCSMVTLAVVDDDVAGAVERLADKLGATSPHPPQVREIAEPDSDELNPGAIGDVISALLPENAIVSDEGITCGLELFLRTQGAPRHDWLAITGGSIGQGLPLSLGASIACPERKVVALQADGSAMYTVQALWSMAREKTDITIVLLNNNSYAILNVELERLKTDEPNDKTLSMLDLSNPEINWVQIAEGMDVPASRVTTVSDFKTQFAAAMAQRGPRLIEVMVKQQLGAATRR